MATTEECNCNCSQNVQKTACCTTKDTQSKESFITEYINTSYGNIPVIKTILSKSDFFGFIKMRLAMGRYNYNITPGLYAVGKPDEKSPVLVTGNYKMTIDLLRKELKDRNFWILVLDTKGINVWCAAGKGTFGTEELVKRIKLTDLDKIVNHKIIVLPQLGAPGVSAHKVKKESGFNVVYGPVRAKDITEFIDSGMKATKEMRRVNFSILDRLFLTPVEIIGAIRISIIALIICLIIGGIREGFLIKDTLISGGKFYLFYISALLSGSFVTPVLLPWIPGRAFSLKGGITGIIVAFLLVNDWHGNLSWFLIIPGISSFFAMNFTGASTYTSLSGVIKEMKFALPIQCLAVITGVILLILNQ